MLKPTRIYGEWDEGIVLDYHMLKSIFLGYDENGKEKFENTRTELGELIYKLKYQKDISCLSKIINLVKDTLDEWNIKEKIDVVIPTPPSKGQRIYQPVFEISKEIAKILKKKCETDILLKEGSLQAKDGNNIIGTIKNNKKFKNKVNVLVVDDLFSTGATLNEVCKTLKKDENINKIYCLVMTKTRR